MAVGTTSLRSLITTAVVGTIAATSLIACSSGTPEDAAATTSPSSTSSPMSSPSGTSSTSATSSSTSPSSPSDTGGGEGEENESSGPLPTGKPLGLGDFFFPEGGYDTSRQGWEENRYDVAGRTQVQGIANTVSGCSASSAKVLELRLKNSFSQLSFSVGQSDGSDSSTQNVTVEVRANNSQVEIQRVPFNQVQDFAVPVTGVNALQILVYLDSEVDGCGRGSVVAVMTDATLS